MKHVKPASQAPAKAQLLPEGHPSIEDSLAAFKADPFGTIAVHVPLLVKEPDTTA